MWRAMCVFVPCLCLPQKPLGPDVLPGPTPGACGISSGRVAAAGRPVAEPGLYSLESWPTGPLGKVPAVSLGTWGGGRWGELAVQICQAPQLRAPCVGVGSPPGPALTVRPVRGGTGPGAVSGCDSSQSVPVGRPAGPTGPQPPSQRLHSGHLPVRHLANLWRSQLEAELQAVQDCSRVDLWLPTPPGP